MTTESFARRIAAMNAMYRLPAHEKPTLPADTADRLRKFKTTLLDEVHEIDDIIAATEAGAPPLETAVAIADLLGDIIVYCRSEALKYGIPLEAVLDIIGKPRSLIEFVADRPGHDYRYALDIKRITDLGWEPRVSFADGLHRTVRWYQDNQAWWRPLKSGEYWDFYKRNYRPLER